MMSLGLNMPLWLLAECTMVWLEEGTENSVRQNAVAMIPV